VHVPFAVTVDAALDESMPFERRVSLALRNASVIAARVVSSGTLPRSAGEVEERSSDVRRRGPFKELRAVGSDRRRRRRLACRVVMVAVHASRIHPCLAALAVRAGALALRVRPAHVGIVTPYL
jgi:hypothetical protein